MIVKQFRYYGKENYQELNAPDTITEEELIAGSLFKDIICQEIRIKTLPGVILEINGETVLIGDAGEYDILYRENVQIITITFNPTSIELLKQNPKTAFFIITFIQKETEEE